MKLFAPVVLIGAAVLHQHQQPLQAPKAVNNVLKAASEKPSSWEMPLEKLQHELKYLTEEARAT